jgi:hypothetical protein
VTAAALRTPIKEAECIGKEQSKCKLWVWKCELCRGKVIANSTEVTKLANTLFEPAVKRVFRPVFPKHFFPVNNPLE